MTIPYDPTISSLIHPGLKDTFFSSLTSVNHLQLAVEAARLSYYSFEKRAQEKDRLSLALQVVGYSGVQTFSSGSGAQAIAAYAPATRSAILAFRGTQPESLEDIGIDASALPTPWQGIGLVHTGFSLAFQSLRMGIQQWLDTVVHDRAELLVCGHSLGAALATLAASVWKPTKLITIGSPRVGDIKFVESLANVDSHRIVNCCDLATRVPPRLIYEHAQGLMFIRHDGTLGEDHAAEVIDKDRHNGRAEFFSRYALIPGNAPLRDLSDHAPINYLRAFWP